MTASKLIWEEDLEKSSEKYHIYGAWIAIIFDPVFGITDYFNIPHAFTQIMSLRLSVSAIAALALLAHKYKYINSKMLIFIPFPSRITPLNSVFDMCKSSRLRSRQYNS